MKRNLVGKILGKIKIFVQDFVPIRTALTELKSVGGILERHFVLLKEHVMKGRLVSASSLDGLRMSLQLRRIGGISEKEHAADVDGKVVEILNNSGFVEVVGDSSAPSPGPPLFRSSSKRKHPAAKSGAGTGSKPVGRGVGARKRAAANTLGGNIINCWAKATGKPVRWLTGHPQG